NYGKVKASFEWDQTPLFYSNETRTLYDTSSEGRLTLPDPIQSGIQNRTLTLPDALTGATTFDLRTRRDVANLSVVYSATPKVDVAIGWPDHRCAKLEEPSRYLSPPSGFSGALMQQRQLR